MVACLPSSKDANNTAHSISLTHILHLSICGTHAARRRRPRNAQGIKLIVGISQGGLGELRLCCPSLFLVFVAVVAVVVYI